MMGKRIHLLWLLCALVLVLSIGEAIFLLRENKQDVAVDAAQSAVVFARYDSVDQLALVSLEAPGETSLLVRRSGTYTLDRYPADMVNQAAADAVFQALRLFYADGVVTEQATDDQLSGFGLATPVCTLSFMDTDGNGLSVRIGAQLPGQSAYYVYVEGLNTVYRIAANRLTSFLTHKEDLLSLRLYPKPDTAAALERFCVLEGNEMQYALSQYRVSEGRDTVFYELTTPAILPLSWETAEALLAAPVRNLEADALVDADAADFDAPDYTLQLRCGGTDYVLRFLQADDDSFIGYSDFTGLSYTISADKLSFLTLQNADLLDGVLFHESAAALDTLSFAADGVQTDYCFSGSGSQLAITRNGEHADTTSVLESLQALNRLHLQPSPALRGSELLRITATYRENTGKPPLTVVFYESDARTVLAELNGALSYGIYRASLQSILDAFCK